MWLPHFHEAMEPSIINNADTSHALGNSVVGEAAVVGSSLCRLVPRMSQLTLGVAVAQSETRLPPSVARSSPPSPRSCQESPPLLGN